MVQETHMPVNVMASIQLYWEMQWVREELKWAWRTSDKCPLVPVDRDDFCRLVGAYGNVLVVGDSINHLV
ncbi:hypothetical protein SUGI_0088550 [Cryptomeria japonica]|nr:hypothetical protein SUGI_0088550 [Cryptomeria japonica]